jgi:hypothetical protein
MEWHRGAASCPGSRNIQPSPLIVKMRSVRLCWRPFMWQRYHMTVGKKHHASVVLIQQFYLT